MSATKTFGMLRFSAEDAEANHVSAFLATLRLLSEARGLGNYLPTLGTFGCPVEFGVMPLTQLFCHLRLSADFARQTKILIKSFTSSASLRLNDSPRIFPNRGPTVEALCPLLHGFPWMRFVAGLVIMPFAKSFINLRLSAHRAFWLVLWALLRMVHLRMFRTTANQLKILDAIVGTVVVFVVDYFCPEKRSSEVLRHDKSMLKNTTILHSIRMAWLADQNISGKHCVTHSDSLS